MSGSAMWPGCLRTAHQRCSSSTGYRNPAHEEAPDAWDVVRKDLSAIGVSEEEWYDEASVSRPRWRSMYKKGLENLIMASNNQEAQECPVNQIKCDECGRSFRRESNKKRHKCISE